ncbi:phospholipid carrier-dependent glycosyltransferase, partial [Silvibacterium sp.]|uniref:phospholipid carrier-dependent glycosyltransferase n=1 Tax=Silvibacterium sp. TaxID=1964179 RepID=UPI0039E5442A
MTAACVLLLIAAFAAQMIHAVRGQSLTWDEDNHIFAGYMSWKTGDFGLNPEHPPLVKLVATLPLLPLPLHVPKLQGRFFKTESYLSGRTFLFGNGPQYPVNTLVFRVRMAAMSLTLLMALLVFLAAQEMFSTEAGLLALTLLVFEPSIVAHGAYVTTDSGVSCFLFATVYALYRYIQRPTWTRLCVTALAAGLALASKHSAVLLAPILFLLLCGVLLLSRLRRNESRPLQLPGAKQLAIAAAVITLLGCAVLWAFYGFRYSARPAPLALAPTLADYTHPLRPLEAHGILLFAKLHLLPESWLYGLTDVRAMANGMQSFVLGKVYEHGVWFYFPVVFVLKSTLGFLALFVLALAAWLTGRLRRPLETLFLLLPPAIYFFVAMTSSLNIGARHILPVWVFLSVFVAGATLSLARQSRVWTGVILALAALHVISSLRAYPNDIAYANELWGGPAKTHLYLNDSNTDWGQQLIDVKKYVDEHHIADCWFAYFVQPFVDFHSYGIPCRPLPTPDTMSVDEQYTVPPVIHGPVFLSAGSWTGFEYGSVILSPYRGFEAIKPDALIDDGVLVYNGTYNVPLAAATIQVQKSQDALAAKHVSDAVSEAQAAVEQAPEDFSPNVALGDAESAAGDTAAARAAYEKAVVIAHTMEPQGQDLWLPQLAAKLQG